MTTVTETSVGHEPAKSHTVTGGGGLRLHVREWGKADGTPIVFIHGWSQSHLCWRRQIESSLRDEFRLVAFDLRGHGMSDAPLQSEQYTHPGLWAYDLSAIIEEMRLERPVLVGWSYGAFVICDYLRAYGQDRIGAIDFVGAAVKLGDSAFGTLIGPGFLEHFADATADDLPSNIRGMRGLVTAFSVKPLPAADTETLLAASMTVPARVRGALAARERDCDDVLAALEVPLLVTQGRADSIVLPAMAEHILAVCPTAEASWYENAAHVPHLEEPERFNHELARLARHARALAEDCVPGSHARPSTGRHARQSGPTKPPGASPRSPVPEGSGRLITPGASSCSRIHRARWCALTLGGLVGGRFTPDDDVSR
jgi:non-heme chloroperoxidase